MPFLTWLRSKSGCAQPCTLEQEVDRLSADSRVHQIYEWFTRHEREIADFQLAITAIPAPQCAEQARAAWLAERLQPYGLSVATDAVGNLLALRPGLQATSPAVAVSAHLDTVFPSSTQLIIRREHAQLLGPGISDNGCGLAALWALAAAFHATGIVTTMPLLFIGNVGEEGEGNLRGMRHIYRECLAHDSISAEEDRPAPSLALLIAVDGAGTENIVSQALGSRRFEIVFSGPGGHSWSDYGAPNPVVAASLVVATLSRIPMPINPRTTLNIGSLEGGISVNTIPERAVVKADLRSSDPARLDELEKLLRRAVSEACAETQAHSSHARDSLEYAIALVGERPAGELPESSPLLAAVRAVDAQLGIRSQLQCASTDANIPLSLGREAVSLGAGGSGGGAHTLHEWFDPAGREVGLKRLALLILLLAGLPLSHGIATGSETPSAEDSANNAAVPNPMEPA